MTVSVRVAVLGVELIVIVVFLAGVVARKRWVIRDCPVPLHRELLAPMTGANGGGLVKREIPALGVRVGLDSRAAVGPGALALPRACGRVTASS